MAKKDDKKDVSYQDLKEELEQVLDDLQHEETDLDKATQLHAKAQELVKQLEAYIEEVEKSLQAGDKNS